MIATWKCFALLDLMQLCCHEVSYMDGSGSNAVGANQANSMGQVFVSLSAYMRIKEHSLLAYPNECCGLLIGCKHGDSVWRVTKAFPTKNVHSESKSSRYEIEPSAILMAHMGAKAQGLEWIGVYHSHPDVPPIPSQTDGQLAWEGLIYIVTSVSSGKMNSMRAWLYLGDSDSSSVNGFHELSIIAVADTYLGVGQVSHDSLSVDAFLDLRGEVLPFNLIKAKEKLNQMRPGQVLQIVFDCERSIKQLPDALEDDGHYIIEVRSRGEGFWEILVMRRYKR
jgi:proteasome lid subunit RPN8/RPN11/TusA-related sulfurtransferase